MKSPKQHCFERGSTHTVDETLFCFSCPVIWERGLSSGMSGISVGLLTLNFLDIPFRMKSLILELDCDMLCHFMSL
jgi:hypothetical protein